MQVFNYSCHNRLPMSDLVKLILSALGAAAGAAVILATLGLGAAVVTTVAGGAAALVTKALPAAVCVGGAAYAASRTGYGGG